MVDRNPSGTMIRFSEQIIFSLLYSQAIRHREKNLLRVKIPKQTTKINERSA